MCANNRISRALAAFAFLAFADPLFAGRIAVRVIDSVGEFYDTATNEVFVPRGNNYTRIGPVSAPPCVFASGNYHTTFVPSIYDACETDRALQRMSQDGYNVVRVILTHQCIDNPVSLSVEYMDNLAHFLTLAQSHGIFVIMATDFPPDAYTFTHEPVPDIEDINSFFLNGNLVTVEAQFWVDFVTELKNRNAPLEQIFAYQLRNEQSYLLTAKPLSLSSGMITTANGQTYDMSNPTDKQAMMDENLVNFVDTMRAEILSVDPTAMVTCGFTIWTPPFTSRALYAMLEPSNGGSSADFVDLHTYPQVLAATLQDHVDTYEMDGITQKPILMGEFGSFKFVHSTADDAAVSLQAWQVESCQYGFDGWLLWTWDTDEQAELWNARSSCGRLNSALSPSQRADACVAGAIPSVSDSDVDGTCDSDDLCPGFDDAVDSDGDGVPDGCDIRPGSDDYADSDGDGIADACDTCAGYDDMLPCPIPAVSEWSLIVMALLLAATGTVVSIRRRLTVS